MACSSAHDDVGNADRKVPDEFVTLGEVTDVSPSLPGRGPRNLDTALGRFHQAEHGAQNGRFAGTVGPQKRQQVAPAGRQVDVVEHLEAAQVDGYVSDLDGSEVTHASSFRRQSS